MIPEHSNIIVKATFFAGGVELTDSRNSPIESLVEKSSYLSETDRPELCINAPIGIKETKIAYCDGYLIWVEGKTLNTEPTVWKSNGITMTTSGIVTGDAMVYDSREREDPHSEHEAKAVLLRDLPPLFLPHKRIRV